MITRDIIEDAYDSIPFEPGTMNYCNPNEGTACGMGAVYIADTGDTDISPRDDTGQAYGRRLQQYMKAQYGVAYPSTWGCGFDRGFEGGDLYDEDRLTYPDVFEARKEGYQMGLFVRDHIAGKTRELLSV